MYIYIYICIQEFVICNPQIYKNEKAGRGFVWTGEKTRTSEGKGSAMASSVKKRGRGEEDKKRKGKKSI